MNDEGTVIGCDLTADGFLAQCQSLIVFIGILVITGKRGVGNSHIRTGTCNVDYIQTGQIGVADINNRIGCALGYIYYIVVCGSGHIIDRHIGCVLDNVDRTLTGCIDGQILDGHTVCLTHIDGTCVVAGFSSGGQGLAVAVQGDGLVDHQRSGQSHIRQKFNRTGRCSCLDSFLDVDISDIADLGYRFCRLNGARNIGCPVCIIIQNSRNLSNGSSSIQLTQQNLTLSTVVGDGQGCGAEVTIFSQAQDAVSIANTGKGITINSNGGNSAGIGVDTTFTVIKNTAANRQIGSTVLVNCVTAAQILPGTSLEYCIFSVLRITHTPRGDSNAVESTVKECDSLGKNLQFTAGIGIRFIIVHKCKGNIFDRYKLYRIGDIDIGCANEELCSVVILIAAFTVLQNNFNAITIINEICFCSFSDQSIEFSIRQGSLLTGAGNSLAQGALQCAEATLCIDSVSAGSLAGALGHRGAANGALALSIVAVAGGGDDFLLGIATGRADLDYAACLGAGRFLGFRLGIAVAVGSNFLRVGIAADTAGEGGVAALGAGCFLGHRLCVGVTQGSKLLRVGTIANTASIADIASFPAGSFHAVSLGIVVTQRISCYFRVCVTAIGAHIGFVAFAVTGRCNRLGDIVGVFAFLNTCGKGRGRYVRYHHEDCQNQAKRTLKDSVHTLSIPFVNFPRVYFKQIQR